MEKTAQLTWWASRITAHLPSLSFRVGIETYLLACSATAVLYVLAYETPSKGAWLVFARE